MTKYALALLLGLGCLGILALLTFPRGAEHDRSHGLVPGYTADNRKYFEEYNAGGDWPLCKDVPAPDHEADGADWVPRYIDN